MGAEPWSYYVPYQANYQDALEKLRDREFEAGRYNPVNSPHFVKSGEKPPASTDEAREMADADGTRSILDMDRVADDADYGVARRLSPEEIEGYFGTRTPTRNDIEDAEFWDDIERGQGIVLPVYQDGKETELFFAGYSYD